MEIIDHESLLRLPRHVSFKGPNGKYLGTVVLNNLGLTLQFLAFDYTAKGRPETWFEVSTDGHGRAEFLSRHTKTFYCLSAAYSSITSEARLMMEELVLLRAIYNADFDLANAIIYGETPVAMATANASNNTDAENTIEFKFTYTESTSSTWSTTNSWMVGMSVSVSFRIPFIGGTEVTTSGEFSGSYDWGETITTENTLETTYSVVVPPRTSIFVRLMATTGTCDIPYSYYQRDMLYDGQTIVFHKDNGLYTAINSYNFRYEVSTLTEGSSDTAITVEQKIPDPLTGLSIKKKIPLPSLSTKAQVLQPLSTSEVTTQEPNMPLSSEEATQDVAHPLKETIQEIPKLSLSPGV
ncbi:hypothetical protein M0R45_025941 [Rubus argutus]|uniref:Aerolysin-like C-terminal domain-containing protein n=1 Tax=Rubus argutus TaxID=59490 RepID=A0AAW1WXU7_RUBAR